jgi:3-hydroxyisobutyrate dehydrogenase
MSDHDAVVAFVGLGAMGTPMAVRLVAGGHVVRGFDVSEEARTRVAALGVPTVETAAKAVEGSDVVILMLPDSNVVEAVLLSEAVLAQLTPSTIVIDMSSSEPLRTRALAEALSARGVSLIDAPVSGGVAGATKGTLTVMVGGESTVLDHVRPVLDTFGKVVHAGPVGSGHAVKALNNLLSATHLLITSEAILAGEEFGLDPEVMLSIFNGSSGRSGSTENKWPNFILPGTFNSGFGLRLMLKDMKIAVDLAKQGGVPCELGAEAVTLWAEAAQELPPTADHTEIARWLQGEAEASRG